MQNFRPFAPKRCSLAHQPPLPIFKNTTSDSQMAENCGSIRRYVGRFDGFNVTIENYEEMVDLYSMGYFGKGSLSSGFPSVSKKNRLEFGVNEVESTTDTPSQSCTDNEESLHLMLEEAFFLSYAVDILDVLRNDEAMSKDDMWIQFQNVIPNFISRYVAYHHFRSKGWVVRPGIKFGGDFVLYKDGPSFYHSSFVVIITYNLSDTERNEGFHTFLAHYRAIEVVKKDLLVCQIIAPRDSEIKNPSFLNKCKVSEYVIKRWIPSANRE